MRSAGFLSHSEFRDLLKGLEQLDLSEEQIRSVTREIDNDNDGYIGIAELDAQLKIVHEFNGHPASPWRLYIDPAQDVICYHNLHTGEQILEHKMTTARLMEVTRAGFVADAELEAINEVRRLKAEDWKHVLEDRASTIMARMYYHWKARREAKRLNWKVQARAQRLAAEAQVRGAVAIESWYRTVRARRLYVAMLALHFEAVVDISERRLYYCNHQTGDSSWVRSPNYNIKSAPITNGKDAPTTVRFAPRDPETGTRRAVLYEPHEFVLSEDGDGQVFFVKWQVPPDRPLQRMWDKPPGYPRCSNCLQHLALLESPGYPGTYCFRCFRGLFDADTLIRRGVRRVEQLFCPRCETHEPASWRCTYSSNKSALVGTVACQKCHDRLARSVASTDDAWARI